jgi:hypothetical protein
VVGGVLVITVTVVVVVTVVLSMLIVWLVLVVHGLTVLPEEVIDHHLLRVLAQGVRSQERGTSIAHARVGTVCVTEVRL